MSDYIYKYTRSQAIQDGVLIDVTPMAKEVGFKWSVAITDTVFHRHIEPTVELSKQGQSTEARLWNTLMMLRYNAKKNGSAIYFYVYFDKGYGKKESIKLKAVAGPGDEGEPVITIMYPEED